MHRDGIRRLSVMWRITLPGYFINNTSLRISPDGRYVAFVRGLWPPDPSDTSPEGKGLVRTWMRKEKAEPWFGQAEVMLIGPGAGGMKRVGYGIWPEFIDGGRSLRFFRFHQPARPPWRLEEYGQAAVTDVATGRVGAVRATVPVGPRVRAYSFGPVRNWYWGDIAGGSMAANIIYTSAPGSANCKLLVRLPTGTHVDDIYETPSGPIGMMESSNGAAGKLFPLANPSRVLHSWRPMATGLYVSCGATPLRDGKLLLEEATHDGMAGSKPLTVRCFTLNPATGKRVRVSPRRVVYPRFTEDHKLIADVIDTSPPSQWNSPTGLPLDNAVRTSRLTVCKRGEKKPIAQWETPGEIAEIEWSPDGSALVVEIYRPSSNGGRRNPRELVYLKLPTSTMLGAGQ